MLYSFVVEKKNTKNMKERDDIHLKYINKIRSIIFCQLLFIQVTLLVNVTI